LRIDENIRRKNLPGYGREVNVAFRLLTSALTKTAPARCVRSPVAKA